MSGPNRCPQQVPPECQAASGQAVPYRRFRNTDRYPRGESAGAADRDVLSAACLGRGTRCCESGVGIARHRHRAAWAMLMGRTLPWLVAWSAVEAVTTRAAAVQRTRSDCLHASACAPRRARRQVKRLRSAFNVAQALVPTEKAVMLAAS